MKKKILSIVGSIAIIALMVFNIQFSTIDNIGNFTLSSLVMQALADGEGVSNCPGGSCTGYQTINGITSKVCDACCPEGKSPTCTTFSCTCF